MLDHILRVNPFLPLAKVLVEADVRQRINAFRQLGKREVEAGGVLLGYRRGSHLHVTDSTLPQRQDKRSRTYFERCDSFHQAYALDRWRESGGQIDYLGEWHTHPELVPVPSCLDRLEWRKICAVRDEAMSFLILGNGVTDWLGIGYRDELRACTESRDCDRLLSA